MPKDKPEKGPRGRLKAFIVSRYSTRVHMSLILASCGLSSMLGSWFLLHFGVHSMLLRYPVAITLSYATFLIGVWTWLRATGLDHARPAGADNAPATATKAKSGKSGIDIDIPGGGGGGGSSGGGGGGGGIFRGGGGSFDGGGASNSFAQGQVAAVQPNVNVADGPTLHGSSGGSSGSSWGSKMGGIFDGIDGDGAILLILALVLIGVVLITSGYLIWCAPDVLTEAAFGAALTGTLSRPSEAHAAGGWVAGVLRKTWWPFALVLVAAVAFAGWSASHYPEASTFRQAITAAVHSAG
jgi:hypothetical protein